MVIDHRTMAASAELSVAQAVALSLQQEIKEKEIQVRGGGVAHSLNLGTRMHVHPSGHPPSFWLFSPPLSSNKFLTFPPSYTYKHKLF